MNVQGEVGYGEERRILALTEKFSNKPFYTILSVKS
jgi:hypothetical protein